MTAEAAPAMADEEPMTAEVAPATADEEPDPEDAEELALEVGSEQSDSD